MPSSGKNVEISLDSPRGEDDKADEGSSNEGIVKRSLRRVSTKGAFGSSLMRGLSTAKIPGIGKDVPSSPGIPAGQGSLQDIMMPAPREHAISNVDEQIDLGWVADQVEQVVHHRGQTNIELNRLQTFNFSTTDSGVISMHDINLSDATTAEYSNYTQSVLRFAPVEVAARLYGHPVPSPSHFFNGYTSVINGEEGRDLNVQAYEHGFEAAVLFSDISGFTKLTNRLIAERDKEGAEILNQIINRFFEELIAIIHRHAGDVIKFAGDAVLSIWSSSAGGDRIQDLTRRAIGCALEQIKQMHNWDTKEGVHLQLHLGLGAGTVIGVDLGNQFRREYVVAGEPLKQLSEAEQQATSGQLVVSPQAWGYAREVCVGTECADEGFGPGFYVVHQINSQLPSTPHWKSHMLDVLLQDPEKSRPALQSLYLYVPGTLRPHLLSGELSKASEFREVTMMFIRIGGLHYSDAAFAARFQRVVFLILSAVYLYQGSLSRLSIDDKGTCAKVTFGLPPLSHKNDPARAVRCGLRIRDHVRPLRLKANIGITTGTVFIGYVGASTRGEYTEYGVMVNMAARFMGKATNEVLVNGSTYAKASLTDTIDFDPLAAVQMKGMDEPVMMYRAVAVIDARYYEPDEMGSVRRDDVRMGAAGGLQGKHLRLVGQSKVMERLGGMLERYRASNGRHGFLCVVRGESGMGKSKVIQEVENELGPQYGVLPILARAMATEASGQLFVWKSILQALPRVLGLLGDGMPGQPQTPVASRQRTQSVEALQRDPLAAHHTQIKQLRNVFRGWLYEKQHEINHLRSHARAEHADRRSRHRSHLEPSDGASSSDGSFGGERKGSASMRKSSGAARSGSQCSQASCVERSSQAPLNSLRSIEEQNHSTQLDPTRSNSTQSAASAVSSSAEQPQSHHSSCSSVAPPAETAAARPGSPATPSNPAAATAESSQPPAQRAGSVVSFECDSDGGGGRSSSCPGRLRTLSNPSATAVQAAAALDGSKDGAPRAVSLSPSPDSKARQDAGRSPLAQLTDSLTSPLSSAASAVSSRMPGRKREAASASASFAHSRRSEGYGTDTERPRLVTEYRASAGVERLGGFEQNESLLNDVLECDFPVHDATLDLSEEVRGEMTMQMLTQIMLNALSSDAGQVVLLLEDVQWMDSASWTLLRRVVEAVPSAAIILTTSLMEIDRSGVKQLPVDSRRLMKSDKATHVRLEPLDDDEIRQLLCVHLEVTLIQPEVLEHIARKTGGNALYCIEIANAMVERAVLRIADSSCTLSPDVEDLDAVGLPTSLQGVISAQLDRLSPYVVSILKAASVVGMQFPSRILDDAFDLEGTKGADDRRKTMDHLRDMNMIQKADEMTYWTQLLSLERKDSLRLGRNSGVSNERGTMHNHEADAVYRFCNWTCREVAYNSLPFEQRRHFHLRTAKWLEAAENRMRVFRPIEPQLKLWLYPMLAEHWIMSGVGGTEPALRYLEEAGRCCLESNMHHEAINFFRKMLKLHDMNSDADATTIPRAKVLDILAEAYLADGRVKPARDCINSALELLDEQIPLASRKLVAKRVSHEIAWLSRPIVIKRSRSLYARPPRRGSIDVEMMVVRLYEHLGRTAYLLDERELHDFAVLRCANLAMLLRRRASPTAMFGGAASLSGLTMRCTKEQWALINTQLARTYAAGCLSLSMLARTAVARRFATMAVALTESLNDPPDLAIYVNMLVGVYHMRQLEWKAAEDQLRRACAVAEPLAGRRAEEAANMLGFTLYMAGSLRAAHSVYRAARVKCLVRHDSQMLGQLTVGVCQGLLFFSEHHEALLLLHDLSESLPASQQHTVTAANASALMAACFLRDGLLDDAQQSASIALGLLKSKGRKTQPSAFWAFANAIGVILSMPAPMSGAGDVVLKRTYRRVAKAGAKAGSARRSSLREGTLLPSGVSTGGGRRLVYHIAMREGSGGHGPSSDDSISPAPSPAPGRPPAISECGACISPYATGTRSDVRPSAQLSDGRGTSLVPEQGGPSAPPLILPTGRPPAISTTASGGGSGGVAAAAADVRGSRATASRRTSLVGSLRFLRYPRSSSRELPASAELPAPVGRSPQPRPPGRVKSISGGGPRVRFPASNGTWSSYRSTDTIGGIDRGTDRGTDMIGAERVTSTALAGETSADEKHKIAASARTARQNMRTRMAESVPQLLIGRPQLRATDRATTPTRSPSRQCSAMGAATLGSPARPSRQTSNTGGATGGAAGGAAAAPPHVTASASQTSMEEASAGAGEASASVSGGGSSSGARRRSSIFRMGSLLQTDSQLWASQVQINFGALREALNDFHDYARANPNAMPRALLYEAMLQVLCGEPGAAVPTMQAALEEAVVRHMTYEEALCRGELGQLLDDDEMVEEARLLFEQLGAISDEEKLRKWLAAPDAAAGAPPPPPTQRPSALRFSRASHAAGGSFPAVDEMYEGDEEGEGLYGDLSPMSDLHPGAESRSRSSTANSLERHYSRCSEQL